MKYLVLPGSYSIHWIQIGFKEFLLGFTGFYWVLLGLTMKYLVLPGFYSIHRIQIAFKEFLLGFTGFYRV